MDKKQGQNTLNTGIGVGGTSILAIFVVLCLVTLASLSLVSAQADYVKIVFLEENRELTSNITVEKEDDIIYSLTTTQFDGGFNK